MIFKCQQCGQEYSVDYTKMKGRLISFDCSSCGAKIDAQKSVIEPELEPLSPLQEVPAPPPPPPQRDLAAPGPEPKKIEKKADSKGVRLGLRGKMFILVFFIPLVILAAAAYYVFDEMNNATDDIIAAGSQPALYLAKREINSAAGEIANEAQLYISQHPELVPGQVQNDPGLRKIILQPVLLSGSASLYIRFGEKAGTFLIHREASLQGKPITEVVTKGRFGGSRYDELGKIVKLGKQHREATSFFLAKEEGILKEKVVTYSPIVGTPYGIMATTYTDDFMEPVQTLETRVSDLFTRVKRVGFFAMGAAFILSGLIIFIYTIRLTGRVKTLTDVANHISLGELGVEADIRANDEIGDLSDAISRMQDSLILSIERLKKRRR